MRISDWSSDVCSSDLLPFGQALPRLLDHPACPPVGRAPPEHGRCRTGTAEHGIALALPHFATARTQGAAVDQVLVQHLVTALHSDPARACGRATVTAELSICSSPARLAQTEGAFDSSVEGSGG